MYSKHAPTLHKALVVLRYDPAVPESHAMPIPFGFTLKRSVMDTMQMRREDEET